MFARAHLCLYRRTYVYADASLYMCRCDPICVDARASPHKWGRIRANAIFTTPADSENLSTSKIASVG